MTDGAEDSLLAAHGEHLGLRYRDGSAGSNDQTARDESVALRRRDELHAEIDGRRKPARRKQGHRRGRPRAIEQGSDRSGLKDARSEVQFGSMRHHDLGLAGFDPQVLSRFKRVLNQFGGADFDASVDAESRMQLELMALRGAG